MTFDETIEKVLNNEDYNTDGLSVDDVITLIEDLRLEYAPTVEMTKNKVKDINSIIREVGEVFEPNEMPEDVKLTDKVIEFEDGFVTLKYLNVILHPETIKMVDE